MQRLLKLLFLTIFWLALPLVALGQQLEIASIDARSTAILDRALAALGGAEAWQAMGAARVRGTMREKIGDAEEKNYPFVTQHDWSSGRHLTQHDLTDGLGGRIKTVDPDKIQTRAQAEAVAGQPRYYGDLVTAALLPAALLHTVRYGSLYRVAADPRPDLHPAGEQSVALFRAGVKRSYWPEQVWIFSADTGLPLRAKIAVSGRAGSPLYKTVTFNGFQEKNSLQVPTGAQVRYPDEAKQIFTFDSVDFAQSSRRSNAGGQGK